MDKLFWIGPRESDIEGLDSLFTGSITLYGSNCGGNIAYCADCNLRINHNIDHPESSRFILRHQLKLIEQHPECRFVSYNPNYTYGAPDAVVERTLCLNAEPLLERLHNKRMFRTFAEGIVPMLEIRYVPGHACSYHAFQNFKLWTNSEAYVIQEAISSGGQGTFYMTAENEQEILACLQPDETYLVSGLIAQNIPVNLHAVLYDEDIVLFPGSVQVIVPSRGRLLYRGADFPSYEQLPSDAKAEFELQSLRLCREIRAMGYRGVLGIDGMFTERGLQILEVNNRFQGSTHPLNQALLELGLPSIQECNLNAFQHMEPPGKIKEVLYNLKVPYSSFTQIHENGGQHGRYLYHHVGKERLLVALLPDGYQEEQPAEDCACQYTMLFRSNILSTCGQNCGVRLHPNLPAPSQSWDATIRSGDLTALKTGLINQGAVITPEAQAYISQHGAMREGTYFSLDLLVEGAYMNCPLCVKLVACSPYRIAVRPGQDGLCLLYYGEILTGVEYDRRPDLPTSLTTFSNSLERICFLATDRLRLQNNAYCTFPKHGTGCRFCEVTGDSQDFSQQEILDAIDVCFSRTPRPFRHVLIGGASNEPGMEHETILAMCRKIRAYSDMPIYLMCLPPRRQTDIEDYVRAGVTEFAFNMELYDRALARRYMPGKGGIPLAQYLDALKWAVDLLGRTGVVRCSFIAGLEPMDSLLEGVEQICALGVAPILSPFRPVPFTEMEQVIPPANEWLVELTYRAQALCARYGLSLGPACPACRNNTLTLVHPGEALGVRRRQYA